jgi:hypothetical protein
MCVAGNASNRKARGDGNSHEVENNLVGISIATKPIPSGIIAIPIWRGRVHWMYKATAMRVIKANG